MSARVIESYVNGRTDKKTAVINIVKQLVTTNPDAHRLNDGQREPYKEDYAAEVLTEK